MVPFISQVDMSEYYLYSTDHVQKEKKNFQGTTAKNVNIHDSLTFRHKITLNRLTCHQNQSISVFWISCSNKDLTIMCHFCCIMATDTQDTAGKSKDELIRDVLLWTPAYGQAKAGWPARTYIQQLCEDTGCSPEDLPKAMNDREKWRKRVRDIRG